MFAAIIILLPIGSLQAQVGGEPPASQDEESKGICQDIPPSGSENSISAKNAPDQASTTSETGKEQAATSWAAPPKESLFKKILRVLYGPNTPSGPNTDVDTNISAGGAAGG